ncbi:MAG: hypothetical protein P8X89_07175 [Reinekea sp.]
MASFDFHCHLPTVDQRWLCHTMFLQINLIFFPDRLNAFHLVLKGFEIIIVYHISPHGTPI